MHVCCIQFTFCIFVAVDYDRRQLIAMYPHCCWTVEAPESQKILSAGRIKASLVAG